MRNNIDNIFKQFNNQTPGCAVCVARKGKIILEKSYGLANSETNTLITPNTAFRLASLTKPFTAMAIMILKERGKLIYEDKLTKFFTDFPDYGKEITVRQLLTHTSGMPDHEKPLYKKIKKGDEPTMYDALEILQGIKKPLFKPGSKYQYSDAGFVVLALIIEKVSGQRYADFLKKNIFIPLQMNNTSVMDETKPEIKNRAYGYKMPKGKYEIFDYDPLNYIIGDEGIYSTIRDLAKWRKAWYSQILVSKATLLEALTLQKVNKANGRCGFSWFIDENILFHDGYWVGFTNIILTQLNTDSTVIVLSNTNYLSNETTRVKIALNVLNLLDSGNR